MDLFKILEILIEFNTVNDPDNGKTPDPDVIDFVEGILNGLGVKTKVLVSHGYRSIVGIVGSGEPRVLLLAHLDVVPFIRNDWKYDPLKLTIEGDLAYGRGTLDDKGNVAAVLKALEDLVSIDRGTFIVAFTTDEEIGGENGARVVRDYLLNNELRPNYVINADGHSMVIINRRRAIFNARVRSRVEKTVINGRRETVRFQLDYKVTSPYHAAYFISGVDTHPVIALSQYVWFNNVYVASLRGGFVKSNVTPSWVETDIVVPCSGCPQQEVDDGLTRLVRALLPLTRFVPRVKAQSIYGVTATPNVYRVVGDHHEFMINIRAMNDDAKAIEEAMIDALMEDFQGIEVKVESEGGGGYLYTPRDSRLVKTASEVLSELGLEARVMEMAGASDARYFSPLGIETIDFGPVGGNEHGPNEYVSIKSLEITSRFYSLLVRRLISS
ncbi:MAG: M20/M25/M40 family metallo-hydrolase [Vulcanisaeta sp.]|uniref:M20/M25/M40 family metallo-hydrolase n=1 Tax=Vulcanisaeta sp. TaxID=2020871 RepID=UPI003D0AA8AD